MVSVPDENGLYTDHEYGISHSADEADINVFVNYILDQSYNKKDPDKYHYIKVCMDCNATYFTNVISKEMYENLADNPNILFSKKEGGYFAAIMSKCVCCTPH